MSIEQIALELSTKLGNKLNKSNEETEVLKYGLFITLHTTSGILLTAILGIITGTFIEVMLISITAALLKRYSGGIHSSSPLRCIILGMVLAFALAIVCKVLVYLLNFNNLIIFSIISLSFVGYVLYKKCPVGNKNKPLKKEVVRKRLRKKAFNFMVLICVLLLILLIIYMNTGIYSIKIVVIAIELGLLLQVFGLTNNGEKFIKISESIFDYTKMV